MKPQYAKNPGTPPIYVVSIRRGLGGCGALVLTGPRKAGDEIQFTAKLHANNHAGRSRRANESPLAPSLRRSTRGQQPGADHRPCKRTELESPSCGTLGCGKVANPFTPLNLGDKLRRAAPPRFNPPHAHRTHFRPQGSQRVAGWARKQGLPPVSPPRASHTAKERCPAGAVRTLPDSAVLSCLGHPTILSEAKPFITENASMHGRT